MAWTKLKSRKSLVLLGLAAGETGEELAKKYNVSPRTIATVACRDRSKVEAYRTEMVERAAGALADGLVVAARRLRHEADHAPEPRDRIAAARALLDKLVVLRPPTPAAPTTDSQPLASVPTEVLRRLVLTAGQATLAYEERSVTLPDQAPGRPPPLTGTPWGAAGGGEAPASSLFPPDSTKSLPGGPIPGDLGPV